MKIKLCLVPFFIGCFVGAGVQPLVEVVKSATCDSECRAQLLYKNSAFYDVRAALSAAKIDLVKNVAPDQAKYTAEYLHKSGIDTLVVMNSGEFLLTSRIGKMAMLATPTLENGQWIWRCKFYSDEAQPPRERACSY